ncbi:MAG: metal ABC transporter ATP-binding protein [Geminocystis sp.]|nr:metal ABC transporter ATP-binding protein [Geminocystis sp.]
MKQEENVIRVENLTVSYRDSYALKHVCLTILPGRLTGIVGPNGAGKSTLLKAMLGLIPSNFGATVWRGRLLSKCREHVAYVPQKSQVDWTYPATVWDVVMMGRVRKTGWLRPFSHTSKQKARIALGRVGMLDYSHRPIGQLSGGQQQRVFLARALVQEAELLFFDEPFTGVDSKTEEIIFSILRDLANQGKFVLVVNHDLGESINNFDDFILLNKAVIAQGKRQVVLNEENLINTYGGRVNFSPQNDSIVA